MPLKIKGSKVKKISDGSEKSKSLTLKDIKDLQEKKPTAAVVVSMGGGSAAALSGAKYKLTMPNGKAAQGAVNGSGGLGAQLEKEGNSKLEFTSLTDDLKKAR